MTRPSGLVNSNWDESSSKPTATGMTFTSLSSRGAAASLISGALLLNALSVIITTTLHASGLAFSESNTSSAFFRAPMILDLPGCIRRS